MGESGFSDRELDVMSILWRRGAATVAEVREELGEELAYTSVLSALQALEAKGHVRHERVGKAYRYLATVPAEAAGRSALSRLLDKVFEGSAERLLAQLVSERKPSEEELKRMAQLLEETGREAGKDEVER
jgi:predicted transcriptional regulator